MTDPTALSMASAAWRDALGGPEPTGNASFFDLGGDSIAAMKVAAILGPALTNHPDAETAVLLAIFERPALADFAAWLEQMGVRSGQR